MCAVQCSFTYIYLQLQFAYSSSTISRRTAKTTLLNYILTQQHGKKIAVIENEYGEVGIDDALVQQKFDAEEEIFEMNNGCICCTVRFESILRVVLFTVVCKSNALSLLYTLSRTLPNPLPWVPRLDFHVAWVVTPLRMQYTCVNECATDDDCAAIFLALRMVVIYS